MAGNTKTAKSRALGSALKAALEEDGMALRELARRIGKDPGVVSRWLSGERSPKESEAAQILTVLGINGDRLKDILELTRHPDAPRWISLTLPEQRQHLNALMQFQRDASHIIDVAPLLVPGLLQIEAYVQAIMTAGGVPEGEITTRIKSRLRHQRILDSVRLTALIGEATLHQEVGGRGVLDDQLRHLVEMAEHENVIIRVIPFSAGWTAALEGAYTVIESTDAPTLVEMENRLSGQFIHAEADVSAYQEAVKVVEGVAMSPQDSAGLIAGKISQPEKRQHDPTRELA